ncbi:MFS transporter [Chromatiales bacterium (ex Bugula neritina AB1)]|nr:MFS transporter [Chromatiales bacterium (ex Bugula neritina AB1)]
MTLRMLLPLLMAAGVLLAGNGLQGTLIAVRGAAEGISNGMIGFMGTAYYLGFMVGCIMVPRLLQSVGHIRTFSALAAIAASATLLLVMVIDAWVWIGLRLVLGFCFSGLFTTVESWINSGVANRDRGRVLSLYRLIDLAAVTGAQFLLPLFGAADFTLFGLMAIMTAISLVPVSLADRSNPRPPASFKFDLRPLWSLSPVACIGCISIGLTNSSFRLVGPLYAQSIGLSITSVATFMSAGIVGGAVLQYPLGMLSDRVDRRIALVLATAGACLAGLYLASVAGDSAFRNYVGIFCFGAFALPLYSLSAAHANDHAGEGDFVMVAAGLTFFFSIGAMAGPVLSAVLIKWTGPQALFSCTSTVHLSLLLYTLWRMRARAAVPVATRKRFVSLLRTSPVFMRLARRSSLKSGNSE